MSVPPNLLYTKDHEWARRDPDGTVTVGVTHFAQEQLGGVVFVELPEEDDDMTTGEPFGQVESTKSVSELFAPIDGTVVEANELLDTQPELVNSDPYGRGWMVRIQPSDPGELDALMAADAYSAHVAAGGH